MYSSTVIVIFISYTFKVYLSKCRILKNIILYNFVMCDLTLKLFRHKKNKMILFECAGPMGHIEKSVY